MDGLLLIDKPTGITSHKVIEIVRKKLNIKKVGHAGTLDPLATGLLIIMFGKFTKLSNLLISQFKTYQVEMKLFVKTDTGDITGKIVKETQQYTFEKIKIQEVINSFDNYTYWQTPPIYSAIKINGKKLYEYARQGKKIDVLPRQVIIKKIQLLEYNNQENTINLEVECSKGTYIRSLINDIANKLITVATVNKLRRTVSGNFHINQAIKLEEINKERIIYTENLEDI